MSEPRYFCRTNLDDYGSTKWPERFAFPPRIGDRVRGEGSDREGMTKPVLKVVGVTHYLRGDIPTVEVELHRGVSS